MSVPTVLWLVGLVLVLLDWVLTNLIVLVLSLALEVLLYGVLLLVFLLLPREHLLVVLLVLLGVMPYAKVFVRWLVAFLLSGRRLRLPTLSAAL
ncbi:hypothetical protein [Nepavirus]|uniref:hypothetical protein n=1 Tax=Nepavirus TaxID=1224510 RepID=UPI00027EDBCD|nr:hypothetical protein [Nepavirus]AFR61150.1 hypothetical protein [Nepavirus]